ncbi:hypothetical protein QJQ45_020057 [Haematococcus lacustris]|nr:hypothetical protein QJQ45_020057 [Haematococcus lacustris]
MVQVYAQPLYRRHHAAIISEAAFFRAGLFATAVALSLVAAYATGGFWTKVKPSLSQPVVHFTHDAFFLFEVGEEDYNFDKKPDVINIAASVQCSTPIKGIKALLQFTYVFQLVLQQRTPIMDKKFTDLYYRPILPFNSSSTSRLEGAANFELHDILKHYQDRNYTTTFVVNHNVWKADVGTSVTIHMRIRIPSHQVVWYSPSSEEWKARRAGHQQEAQHRLRQAGKQRAAHRGRGTPHVRRYGLVSPSASLASSLGASGDSHVAESAGNREGRPRVPKRKQPEQAEHAGEEGEKLGPLPLRPPLVHPRAEGAHGRVLRVDGELAGRPVSLVCVSAPAQQADRPAFYAECLPAYLPPAADRRLLPMGGDFNCILASVDRVGIPRGSQHGDAWVGSRGQGAQQLRQLVGERGLVDPWRHLHPSKRDLTHFNERWQTGARLDRWYISEELVQWQMDSAIQGVLPHFLQAQRRAERDLQQRRKKAAAVAWAHLVRQLLRVEREGEAEVQAASTWERPQLWLGAVLKLCYGDRSSFYFYNRDQPAHTPTLISSLQLPSQPGEAADLTTPAGVKAACKAFQRHHSAPKPTGVYAAKPVNTAARAKLLGSLTSHLTPTQARAAEGPDGSPTLKAPGLDGLPMEVYDRLWVELGPPLRAMLREALGDTADPAPLAEFLTGILTLVRLRGRVGEGAGQGQQQGEREQGWKQEPEVVFPAVRAGVLVRHQGFPLGAASFAATSEAAFGGAAAAMMSASIDSTYWDLPQERSPNSSSRYPSKAIGVMPRGEGGMGLPNLGSTSSAMLAKIPSSEEWKARRAGHQQEAQHRLRQAGKQRAAHRGRGTPHVRRYGLVSPSASLASSLGASGDSHVAESAGNREGRPRVPKRKQPEQAEHAGEEGEKLGPLPLRPPLVI